MPLSYATFTGNSGSPQSSFTIPYNYILKDHIKVYYGRDILANTQTSLLVSGTDYSFTADNTIQLIGSTLNSGTTTGNPHNLANGVVLTIERDTPDSSQIVEFADGSNLTGDNLNNANLQNLFVVQEQQDKNDISAAKSIAAETASNAATTNVANLTSTQFASNGSIPMSGDINANSNKIKNLADPTNAQDGVTKAYLERTGSISSTQILDGTILNADINTSAGIAGTKVAPSFGSQNLSTTGTAATGALTVTGAIAVSTTVDGRDVAADGTKLDTIETNAKDDQTAAEIKTLLQSNKITNNEIEVGTLDNRYYTETEADARFYNLASVEEIQSGETWVAADNKVATTSAIDARIVDLVDDVGGFVPIANETSFPNANPDVNNGAGTLVSIQALSQNLTSDGSGQISINNGTVGNSTVTITGAANSTTYAATYGLIVETTSTLNTYTFHRLVPKATEVTTVATNLTNINKVAVIDANVTKVANIDTNVTKVADIDSNVTTVANNDSNVTTVAGKATEIGRLGTADAVADMVLLGTAAVVEDMSILGTTDVVADLNTLGAADVVSDMNALAVSDVISDMNTLAVSGVISDMDTVATNVTNVNNVGGSIANVNTTAGSIGNVNLTGGSIANVNTTAGAIANVNTVAGSIANVNTVSTNITNVTNASNYLNNFLQLYLGEASSNPTVDGLGNAVTEGDLYFNTVDKRMRVFNGSVFQNLGEGVLEVAKFATAAFNALYTASAGSNSIDLGSLAITGAVFSNEAIAANRVSLGKGSGTFNLGGI